MSVDQSPGSKNVVSRGAASVEHVFERVVFGARWILAPFYAGMVVALMVLLIKFLQKLWEIISHGGSQSLEHLVLE